MRKAEAMERRVYDGPGCFQKYDPSDLVQERAVRVFREVSLCGCSDRILRVSERPNGLVVKCRGCSVGSEDGSGVGEVHVSAGDAFLDDSRRLNQLLLESRRESGVLRDHAKVLDTLLARAREERDNAIAAHTKLVERLKGAAVENSSARVDAEYPTTRGALFIWQSLLKEYEDYEHDDDGARQPATCIAKVPDRGPVVACQGDWMERLGMIDCIQCGRGGPLSDGGRCAPCLAYQRAWARGRRPDGVRVVRCQRCGGPGHYAKGCDQNGPGAEANPGATMKPAEPAKAQRLTEPSTRSDDEEQG